MPFFPCRPLIALITGITGVAGIGIPVHAQRDEGSSRPISVVVSGAPQFRQASSRTTTTSASTATSR